MKCPKCGNRPVSPAKYILHPNLRRTKCSHCGVQLKRNRSSYYVWYGATLGAVVVGLSMALLAVYLQESADWSGLDAFLMVIGLLFIIGIPIELLLFKYENYTVNEDSQPLKSGPVDSDNA